MNSTTYTKKQTPPSLTIDPSPTETSDTERPLSNPASPSSPQSLLRKTLFVLATEKGFLADHSKKQVDDSTSFYTHRYEDALSYTTQEAAVLRAQLIIDIEPTIEVKAIELYCGRGQYPYGWMEA